MEPHAAPLQQNFLLQGEGQVTAEHDSMGL